MDMSSCCANCGRKSQDYLIFCRICNDYYCSEKCHFEKHKLQYQKFCMEIRKLEKEAFHCLSNCRKFRKVRSDSIFFIYQLI